MYLIATSLGHYQHGIAFDTFLATLLSNDGSDVDILLCDGVLPACQMSKLSRTDSQTLAEKGQDNVCNRCLKRGKKRIASHNSEFIQKIIYYSDFISEKEKQDIDNLCNNLNENELRSLVFNGAPVGEHGFASALRFFARGDLDGEQFGLEILKKYVIGAARSYIIFSNIFSKSKYERAIIHHGIYTPQGLAVAAAKKHKVGVVTWVKSYRDQTFLLSHSDSYHHTMLTEPKSEWSDFNFDTEAENLIDNYLFSRQTGENDWISFNKSPVVVSDKSVEPFECLLLTSVLWDAQVHYKANLFNGILNWVLETISFWIENKKNSVLCVRIHPAETTGYVQSRQKINDEIKKNFPNLPKNIIIIDSNNRASTYDLVLKSDYVVTYSTKASMEAAAMGKPIIVCGDAWIRNKNISLDPKSEKEYFNLLLNPEKIKPLTLQRQRRAKKYAYHFFLRRMLEIDCFKQNELGEIQLEKARLNNPTVCLQNSKDVILNGIYTGSPFILHQELLKVKNVNKSMFNFLGSLSNSAVLQVSQEIDIAKSILERLEIPLHHDMSKNWDMMKMLTTIQQSIQTDGKILDAGCGYKAHMATKLFDVGYVNLFACDIVSGPFVLSGGIDKKVKKIGRTQNRLQRFLQKFSFSENKLSQSHQIKSACNTKKFEFTKQDVCRTTYPNEYFDAVCSVSVIEHLEAPEAHISEASRILKKGGQFLITTDYWPEKINTSGIYPYGEEQPEMKVFSEPEIVNLVKFAKTKGLSIREPYDLRATDKVCKWDRVNRSYTFLFLRFFKD